MRSEENRPVIGLIWGLTTVIYLVLGFLFNLWHPGWIIYVLAGVISLYLMRR